MCGIIGYIGKRSDAGNIVFTGLKSLEYRGYDSWGVAVKPMGKNSILVKKKAGKIKGNTVSDLPASSFGLGHTRWATHGGVSQKNAHPHLDCTKNFALVHNGIIENYQEIKKSLRGKHRITSETDTEIFAHLVEEYRTRWNLEEAVRRAFIRCQGLSAFLIAEKESETLIAVKAGSPLVIGVGKGENAVASDADAILSLTQSVIFLEDNQLAAITKSAVRIVDTKTGKRMRPKVHHIPKRKSAVTKKRYPHFMLKEISEQPKVIDKIGINFDSRIARFARLLSNAPKIYLVGCGTAHYAAMAGSYMLSKIAQIEATPIPGSEFAYKEPFIDNNTLILFLSQSGETIDIIESLKSAKALGAKTVALVNVFGSSLYRLADERIWLEAGPEICVLSTKAFTAKLATLGLISYETAGKRKEGKKLLQSAIKELIRIISPQYQRVYIDPLVKRLNTAEHIFAIGRGLSHPIALETVLKIKEVSYIHAEGFPAGELKHGPIALIEGGIPCFVLAPDDETHDALLSGAIEVKSRGGYIVGIAQQANEIFDVHLPVRDCGIFTSIPQTAIAQLVGYKLAVTKKLDPDKPRNLAKSVTVK